MSTKVFQFLLEDVLATLHTFITETSTMMATIAGAAGSTIFAIYVIFWGMAILSGKVQEPLVDGFMRIIRGVVILAFATSAGIYSEHIVEFFWTVPGAIGAEVAQAGSSGDFAMTDNTATAQMLDASLGKGLKAGESAWNLASATDLFASIGYIAIAVFTWVFVAIVCAAAGALVLVSNIGLSIMLGLGPIFILCAMFESTQQLFVAWSRQVITFAVFFIVLAAAITLTFGFFVGFIDTLDMANASELIVNFLKLICVSAACLFVLWRVESMASGLAGGVGLAAGGTVARMVGNATGGIASRQYDPTKANADGSRGGHRWRGAVPAFVGGVAVGAMGAAKAGAYMRRNQLKQN